MASSVSLPFTVPNFATFQSSAAAELAMIGHPTAYNRILNRATNICCNRKFLNGYSSPLVSIPNISLENYNFIEKYYVNFRHVYSFCLDIIKTMLEEGMYVYYEEVDDFYLPGKSWYGTRHMHHTGIICGYDDNDKTLSIAAHDINWVFNIIRVPQKSFLQALESSLNDKRYGNMIAYKIKEDTVVKMRVREMLKFLKPYIDSSFEKYPINEETDSKDSIVEGVVVHDYLAIYIEKLIDGSIPYEKMDWRALRPVWEHKKCMLDRIKAMEQKKKWGDELSKSYSPIVEKTNTLRMMYAMYHKNHNNKLLFKIRDGLLDLSKNDRLIVDCFIKKLENELIRV